MALALFHDGLFGHMDDMLLHPHLAFAGFPRGRKAARMGPCRLAKAFASAGRSHVVEADDGSGVTVVAELPGFRRDEVDIQVLPGPTRGTHVLRVRGEHRESATHRSGAIEAADAPATLEAAPPLEDGVIRDEDHDDREDDADGAHAEGDKAVVAAQEEPRKAPAQPRGGPRWTSRSSTTFERTFVLPAGADTDGIRAKLDDGVLQVWVPRKPESPEEAPRRITIH